VFIEWGRQVALARPYADDQDRDVEVFGEFVDRRIPEIFQRALMPFHLNAKLFGVRLCAGRTAW
jgi:hypothetical protein